MSGKGERSLGKEELAETWVSDAGSEDWNGERNGGRDRNRERGREHDLKDQ